MRDGGGEVDMVVAIVVGGEAFEEVGLRDALFFPFLFSFVLEVAEPIHTQYPRVIKVQRDIFFKVQRQ